MARAGWVVVLAVSCAAGCRSATTTTRPTTTNTTHETPADYQAVLERGAPSLALGVCASEGRWSLWHDRLLSALKRDARLLRVTRATPDDAPKRVDMVLVARIEELGGESGAPGTSGADTVLTLATLGLYPLLGGGSTRVDRRVAIEVEYWGDGRVFRTLRRQVAVAGRVHLYAPADSHHETLRRVVNESILYDLLAQAVPQWTRR